MPEALPTSILSALFWATLGTTFVRFRWRATYDQLSMLWLMSVFCFALVGAPLILIAGRAFGLGFSAIASIAPSIAYRFHFGGVSPSESARWSVLFYAALLLTSATVVALSSSTFVQDLRVVSGLSPIMTLAVLLLVLLTVGLIGVVTALQVRAPGVRGG